MVEQQLRIDPDLAHGVGPVPANLAEGLVSEGGGLTLQQEPALNSMAPPLASPDTGPDWGLLFSSIQGSIWDLIPLLQWLFLIYFLSRSASYLLLNLASLWKFRINRADYSSNGLAMVANHNALPVTIILPVGQDASAATACIQRLLQLEYPEYEIIVVVNGKNELGLNALLHEFSFVPFPGVSRDGLSSTVVKGIYASTTFKGLRLLDMEGDNRADALNAALNFSIYPLVCTMDARYSLRQDAVSSMAAEFQRSPATEVVCVSVEALCDGVQEASRRAGDGGLPRSWLALCRSIEQLKFERLPHIFLSGKNAMLLSAESLSLLRREAVIAAGGYRSDALDAEAELFTRIHFHLRKTGKDYRIAYLPESLCWAELPDTFEKLKGYSSTRQAILMQCLEHNRQMFLNLRHGFAGLAVFPFLLLFEGLGPMIEFSSYMTMAAFYVFGLIDLHALAFFWMLVVGAGVLPSMAALVQEALIRKEYLSIIRMIRVIVGVVLESIFYRHLTVFWRFMGLFHKN